MKIGLVGPSYQEESLLLNAQRSINVFPVLDQQGKETASLFGVPGLALFTTCGQGPGRKCFASQNGRAFVIAGAGLYEVLADGTATLRGSLLQTQGRVTVAENSAQMAVCDGRNLFIFTYSSNAFAKVTDADLPECSSVTFMDGYFIVAEVGAGRFYISAINDGTSWDALDFATAESSPDNLRLAFNAAGQLWLLGELTTEVWSNTGSSDFPFRRISGARIDVGAQSVYTVLEVDNSIMWLGKDSKGGGVVYRASGFTPERISTPPMERKIQESADLENCIAYCYQQNGRWFYVLTGGGLETSWAYDLSTRLWHERAQLNNQGDYEQHIGLDHMFVFDKHLLVDRRNGRVYRMDEGLYDNAGEVRSCERIFTHVSEEDARKTYRRLTVGVEAGVGLQTGQGSDPLISLRISKDGGRSWGPWYEKGLGKAGRTERKATWRRLGMAEVITFGVRVTDPVKVAWTGAYLS